MEAVVTKMSRIIAHVGSQSEQGQQILSSIQASMRCVPPRVCSLMPDDREQAELKMGTRAAICTA